ncbi:hypothetical protein N5P37_008438 [Trichoderma harzianum]|nr:hypothetical protein N5P37_008438 [Trichoderma harzianum]
MQRVAGKCTGQPWASSGLLLQYGPGSSGDFSSVLVVPASFLLLSLMHITIHPAYSTDTFNSVAYLSNRDVCALLIGFCDR